MDKKEHSFLLSCESTVDLPYEYVTGRGISVVFYTYAIDGVEYEDNMGRDPKALPWFYAQLAEGKLPSTSQINLYRYMDYFDALLQQGDVLHIAFSSGITPSQNNAVQAAELLKEKYPDRRLVVVDSMAASSGYGLLLDTAADLWDAGCGLDELRSWVEANRNRMHHHFYSTDIKYFRRSGRVSGPAAAVGSILNICPLMRLDDRGHMVAFDKVRGKKAAIQATLRYMEQHAEGGAAYRGRCWMCYSDCPELAEETRAALKEHFPGIDGEIWLNDIGNIIASHTGPGTVSIFFWGDERDPE